MFFILRAQTAILFQRFFSNEQFFVLFQDWYIISEGSNELSAISYSMQSCNRACNSCNGELSAVSYEVWNAVVERIPYTRTALRLVRAMSYALLKHAAVECVPDTGSAAS